MSEQTKKPFTLCIRYSMMHTMEMEAENEEDAKDQAVRNFLSSKSDEDYTMDEFVEIETVSTVKKTW